MKYDPIMCTNVPESKKAEDAESVKTIDKAIRACDAFPKLTGSEKQIKWAEDIREDFIYWADYILSNAKRAEAIKLPYDDARWGLITVKGAEKCKADAYRTANQITEAKKWIDMKQNHRDIYAALARIAAGLSK